ncbi:MAG: DUF1456 domain-containing protein [Rhodanobacter denitrificans]|uniref:DUF1456 domain-containing protein n=1 Tax=Rhodanobacter denitrificans TaxID=666685 RepID=A0A2W5K314_9GAMM|nr:MAG: DUF1456 domain-containing protein [Rhodanobacter denitrificans]
MIHNDVLRGIRYALDLSEPKLIELIHTVDPAFAIDRDGVRALLLKEDEPGHVPCSDAVLARFLDGLIVDRRGRDEGRPERPFEARVSNNLVLKKLRIAFELTDLDMLALFDAAGFAVSKSELSALFRQPDHRNYRPCGDQMLRNFLKGLIARLRTAPSGAAERRPADVWTRAQAAASPGGKATQKPAPTRRRTAPRR